MMIFFNDTPTTEIYTLSLHSALPIGDQAAVRIIGSPVHRRYQPSHFLRVTGPTHEHATTFGRVRLLSVPDRKSTRLNSSHANISYAVFCLKKKNQPTLPSSFHSPFSP